MMAMLKIKTGVVEVVYNTKCLYSSKAIIIIALFSISCSNTFTKELYDEKYSYVIINEKNNISYKSLGARKNQKVYLKRPFTKRIFTSKSMLKFSKCDSKKFISLYKLRVFPKEIKDIIPLKITTVDDKTYFCIDLTPKPNQIKRYFTDDNNIKYVFVVDYEKVCNDKGDSHDLNIKSYLEQEFQGLIID